MSTAEVKDLGALKQVPDVNLPIRRARDQFAVAGREGEEGNRSRLFGRRVDLISLGRVPQADQVSSIGSCQEFVVARKGTGHARRPRDLEAAQFFARGRTPGAKRLIRP